METELAIGISVVILTFNSDKSIETTLLAAKSVSDDIHVVDSFSTDRTEEIVRAAGAHFYQHGFVNYGAQRNWAIDNLPLRHGWELHLDADERPSPDLAQQLRALTAASVEGVDGFRILDPSPFILPRPGDPARWHVSDLALPAVSAR